MHIGKQAGVGGIKRVWTFSFRRQLWEIAFLFELSALISFHFFPSVQFCTLTPPSCFYLPWRSHSLKKIRGESSVMFCVRWVTIWSPYPLMFVTSVSFVLCALSYNCGMNGRFSLSTTMIEGIL